MMNGFNKGIFDILRDIFLSRFNIDLDIIPKECLDKHLLGSVFKLAPRDLVYIYLDVEKKFDISLPDEEVAKGGMSTVNRLAEMIGRQLNKIERDAV